LDDDDAWEPTKVESQLALIAKENVSIVYSGKKVVIDDELDKVIRLITPLSDSITFSSLCSCNYIGSTSSVVIKRKDFENSGGFDISLKCFQDYDLWLRLLKYGIAISDGKTNVIYTVFKKKNMQISRSTDGRHIIAGEYLQLKYKSIMTDKEMKLFTANLYQLVSKASNHSKPITSLKFAILSLYIKPSLRGIKFLVASLLSLLGYKHV
jgi:GT2 family glycosyltransferase